MLRISGWINNENTVYENLLNEMSFRIRCAIPCIVQSFNSVKKTVECQPAIRERMIMEDGTIRYIDLPLLVNVPVVYPQSSLFSLQFPLTLGDEVLVIFSDLSIDNFWLNGNVQNPVEVRRHDLSDGIAIPCKLSRPNSETVSTSNVTIKFGDSEVVLGSSAKITNGAGSIKIEDGDITLSYGENSITLSKLIALLNQHYHLDADGRSTTTPRGV